jgi:hypothetical protein
MYSYLTESGPQPSIMACIYSPSTWEGQSEGSQVWGQSGICSETLSQNKLKQGFGM